MPTPTVSHTPSSALDDTLNDTLDARHSELLQHHGISTKVAVARGYISLSKVKCGATWKKQNRFVGAQALLLQGLIVPTFGIHGQPTDPKIVPDFKRENGGGGVIKFEEAHMSSPTLDLHPLAYSLLTKAGTPWFYTTNILHSDALVSMGYPAFTLSEGNGTHTGDKAVAMYHLAVEFQEHVNNHEEEHLHVLVSDEFPDLRSNRYDMLAAMAQVLQQREADVVTIHPQSWGNAIGESRVQDIFKRLSRSGLMAATGEGADVEGENAIHTPKI